LGGDVAASLHTEDCDEREDDDDENSDQRQHYGGVQLKVPAGDQFCGISKDNRGNISIIISLGINLSFPANCGSKWIEPPIDLLCWLLGQISACL